jgi:uracil-DNA glycosylase
VTPRIMDALFEAADVLETSVEQAVRGQEARAETAPVIERLRAMSRMSGEFPVVTEPLAPPAPPAPLAPPPPSGKLSAIAPPGLVVGSGERELFGGPIGQAASLDQIAEMVRTCSRCPLYATAINPVPGEGSPTAQLMCIGEAPGATEDETGRPFVGAAGKLLTDILRAIKLSREEVFIANVMKHRPPGNRNPTGDEVVACSPYLVRQVELIRPKVILALGTFAAQTLLDTNVAIGKLRGAMHWYHGTPLIATYHPAALLRNPGWKKPTWEDVKLVRRILDSVVAA